jgi:hypothetical protein
MEIKAIIEHLESAYETELARLGSSKAMYAVTGGEMESEAVLRTMADRAIAGAITFEAWAEDMEGELAAGLEQVADDLREHAESMASHAGGYEPSDAQTALEAHLRSLEGTADRLAGFVAWAEVTDRTLSQAVGFFVGNADTQAANLFRDVRATLGDEVDAFLENADLPDADSETIESVAGEAVEAAYGHYVDALERLGIKVKPVC